MGHGHLGVVMLLSGALMVLVPIGIGILVAGVVLHDRRRKGGSGGGSGGDAAGGAKQDGSGGRP